MFRNMPLILLALIISVILFGSFLPLSLIKLSYTISLTIKSFIIFILPLIIFGLLFKSMKVLAKDATKIVMIVVTLVCCSNYLTTFLSHFIGEWIYSFNIELTIPESANNLKPTFSFTLPTILRNDLAMFLGIILGIILPKIIPQQKMDIISLSLDRLVALLLKLINFAIPFFVLGFLVKLQYEKTMNSIVKEFSLIFIIIAISQFTYISTIYLVLNKFKIKGWLQNMSNMFPALVSGFSTMSSAASMPLTILGVEKNAKNKDLAKSIIPITVNIHLIGDCIAIPVFAYAILKSFGFLEPSLLSYLVFAFYFIIAKFSVAAVPGGGVFVMLPILEKYLEFNDDMMSMIVALYILFDPIITSANILGNSAFAVAISKLKRLTKNSKT